MASQFADVTMMLMAMLPETQEFYLFCFFCLGFVIFRSEAVRSILAWDGRKAKGKAFAPTGVQAQKLCTLEQLRSNFAQERYEQVLTSWPLLESYTAEALSLVVTALMALGRMDDIGLFIAKSVAKLPHLRSSLQHTITAIQEPACQVPRQRVASALREVFDRVRDDLGRDATETLLIAFARLNDQQRVGVLLQALASRGQEASPATLEEAARGFFACRNVDAGLGQLRRLLLPTGCGGVARDLLVEAVRACLDEEPGDGEEAATARPRAWDALELLEAADGVPVEAPALLLEHAARHSPCDVALAERAEQQLRAAAEAAGVTLLPFGTYDALVRVHASVSGNQAKARACFDELVDKVVATGRGPSEGSLVGMISACFEAKSADLAENICQWAWKTGRCTLPVFSATIKVLAAAKQPARICELYGAIASERLELDDTMYGQLIKFAVQAGQNDLARHLFKLSHNPDAQNYMSLMRACGQEGNVPEALAMLWDLSARGQADTAAYNSALDVCVSCNDKESAATVFEVMKSSDHVDIVSYNILLKQYVGESSSISLALADELLQEMKHCGFRPNTATYNSLLGGVLAMGDFARAWRTINIMEEEGPGIDAYTISILFKGYKGKRSFMDAASFDCAIELIQKYSVKVDEVLVNVALEACVGLRDPARLTSALNTFRRSGWAMPRQCAMHTYATLIKAYGQSRQLNMAWKLWSDITCKKGLVPSEQLYGQMIDVLVTNDHLDDALVLFEEMKTTHQDHLSSQGFAVAYAMVIKGFAQRKECARALECYEEMKEHGTTVGLVVFNTLIDACSRVGDMDAAARLFRDMVDAQCVPDLITYSTLIKGYCVRGELDQAMELFTCMRRKGILPDAIVFNSLLDGCAKKQMPALCEQVVNDMVEAGVKPSNHSASILIKLYGRCCDLDAAFRVMNEMPQKYGFRPNAAVYTCLMSSCIGNSRMDLAMNLRKRMIEDDISLDEKTYSTLLRGALRSSSVESCVVLINAALDQGGRRLLDEELVQGALSLVQRRRLWDERGRELFARLREAGVAVRPPADAHACPARPHGGRYSATDARPQRRRFPAPKAFVPASTH
mmetsp:Transcript_11565/g.32548  ORF Transcript_11565/g.32548 Transcript_11565/m.32548 type:complete len:1085 (-) Transcript_11565:249-3503(-)